MKTTPHVRIREYEAKGWWEGLTLHGQLRDAAAACGDRHAVADPPDRVAWGGGSVLRLSFAELDRAATLLAAQLRERGVGAGDTVLVQLPNMVELVAMYFAACRIGAVVSPLPMLYGAHEIRHIAGVIAPRAMITLAKFRDVPFAEHAEKALGGGVDVLSFGGGKNALQWGTDVDAARARAVADYEAAHAADANAIATICWTSGTTGTPKGVPRSHNMWVASARACIEAGGYQDGDRLLNPFPLVNMAAIAAFLYPCVLVRSTLVLHQPMNPPAFLAQMQDEKITFTIAPPLLLNQLARNEAMWKSLDFSALRAVGSGSAPLAPWMIETFDKTYGKPVINFYGSNEGVALFCTPQTAADPTVRATMFPSLGSGRGNWIGTAASFVRTRVVDVETGEEITTPGRVGELLFGGATVFDGYLGTDNAGLFDNAGMFHTGDLVEIGGDPPHYFRIAGRCKDIINRGGMKISPSEIDVLLEGMPQIKEAAVCGYADAEMGERVCACVVPADPGKAPTLEAVTQFLADKGLAKFKWPERLVVLDALPRNPLGKVQRFLLQERVEPQETRS